MFLLVGETYYKIPPKYLQICVSEILTFSYNIHVAFRSKSTPSFNSQEIDCIVMHQCLLSCYYHCYCVGANIHAMPNIGYLTGTSGECLVYFLVNKTMSGTFA